MALFVKSPRVGLEPTSGNCQPVENKELTENLIPVLSTSLDKSLQKQAKIDTQNLPDDLAEIVAVWPKLPEHIKTAIRALVKTCSSIKP